MIPKQIEKNLNLVVNLEVLPILSRTDSFAANPVGEIYCHTSWTSEP